MHRIINIYPIYKIMEGMKWGGYLVLRFSKNMLRIIILCENYLIVLFLILNLINARGTLGRDY